jgi:hypothetical protein
VPFHGEVVVTPIPPECRRWRLVEPFTYEARDEPFTVPRDFTTDFASVPRVVVWLLPRYGPWTQAAILHDHLWAEARRGAVDRYDADGIFLRAMRELGVPFLRRWIMWTAVRWASGPRSWFARGPVPVLKMVAVSVPTLAVITVPAVVVFVALLVGAAAEYVVYLPLRLFHRDEAKDVNAPEAQDIVLTG